MLSTGVAIDCRLEEFHIWHDNDVICYFRILKVCTGMGDLRSLTLSFSRFFGRATWKVWRQVIICEKEFDLKSFIMASTSIGLFGRYRKTKFYMLPWNQPIKWINLLLLLLVIKTLLLVFNERKKRTIRGNYFLLFTGKRVSEFVDILSQDFKKHI